MSKNSEAVMSEIQKEYMKYLLIARNKDKDTGGDKDESKKSSSTYNKFMSQASEYKQKMTDKFSNISMKDLKPGEVDMLNSFMSKAKKGKESMSNVNMPTWKKGEAPKRPEDLELGLVGIALFSGDELISRTIRRFTKSKYSHVALLLYDVSMDKEDEKGWYIYSANGSASQILDEHRMPMVQLEKWMEVVPSYKGAAGVRLMFFRSEPDVAQVTQLVDKYMGLPYETQVLVMLKSLNRSNVEGVDHANSAFCSEICYRFLTSIGVLEDTEVPENVWPKDFSEENEKLPVSRGNWGDIKVKKGDFEGKSNKK